MKPTPMTPPPPTPDPTPKADSGAGASMPLSERDKKIGIFYRTTNGYCYQRKRRDEPVERPFVFVPFVGTNQQFETASQAIAAALPDPSLTPPPQSDPALAAAEAIEYHNPDKLHSAGEPPWRFLVNGEGPEHGDQWRRKDTAWREMPPICNFYPTNTYRTRRPLPLAPAPAPEGRGETPRTDRAAKNLDTREEVLDFARSLEIENNELRELKSTWEIGAKRHNEVKAQRAAAVAQAQAASELTARWRNLVKAYVSERSAHGRDDHSCALCAALASSPPALAASEAGK